MKIAKPTSTIYLESFDSISIISSGEALSSSYYTKTNPQTFGFSAITEKIIKIQSSSHVFFLGESILYIDENGILKKNIISAIGEIVGDFVTYELLNEVNKSFIDPDSELLIIKKTNIKIDFDDCPEDEYYILPTNEKLVIRSTFANPEITFSEFTAYYPDIKNYNEFYFAELKKVSLNMIYADLDGYKDFYNIIHTESLRNLLFFKIMCAISNRFANQNTQIQEETPCRKYEKALEKFTAKLKLVNNSGNTPSTLPPQNYSSGSYSL